MRLAGAQVGDVLGLRLQPRGRVHVGQVVSQRQVERVPVFLAHGLETVFVGTKDIGLGPSRHDTLLIEHSLMTAADRTMREVDRAKTGHFS